MTNPKQHLSQEILTKTIGELSVGMKSAEALQKDLVIIFNECPDAVKFFMAKFLLEMKFEHSKTGGCMHIHVFTVREVGG